MRIKTVTRLSLDVPVPVYDLTVAGTHNFCLVAGKVFVHNSKDVSDAICGVHKSLMLRRSTWRGVAEVMHETGSGGEIIRTRPSGKGRPGGRPNPIRPTGRKHYID